MSEDTIKVLLVEDNPTDQRLAEKMLADVSGTAFDLKLAGTLSQAVEFLREGGIEVVLTDLSLPDSPGYETFSTIRTTFPQIPIIVLTGMENEDMARRALREGAQDYIPKGRVETYLLRRSIRYAIERARADDALRESEERYALAVRGANDGIWDWNLATNEIYFSPRWKSMLGYAEDEIGNDPEGWFRLVHPNDLQRLRAKIEAHIDGYTTHFENEHQILHKDGSYRWMLTRGIAVRDENGQATRMAGSQTDITTRKTAEEKLLHDAFHDSLTGLPNRMLFMDRLERSIRRTKRNRSYQFAVLFLDLDRFKIINDSLGHMIGDQMLIQIGKRLSSCIRPGDTIARLGGDEFCILVDDIRDMADATRVADRIQVQLGQPFYIEGHELYTTVSIGISLSSSGYDRPEHVLRDSDTAMYRAKGLGRSCYQVFDQQMHANAMALLNLENDMRRALDYEQFRIQYQPIVDLDNGRLTGFEALVRWHHPVRGIIPPADFIPLAEETGLIVPIGFWVLAESCRQMSIWQGQFNSDPPLTISVNLSNRQFMQSDLIERIDQVLGETSLVPGTLILEITESVLMHNPETSIRMLEQLRDRHVRLHIDDFGTGYSSLSYLQHIPTDTLKIDRSFVSGVLADSGNSEIIRTIVTLARNLGMNVTAEGLETADQLSLIRELKCERGQGFYFSQPVDNDVAESLISNRVSWS